MAFPSTTKPTRLSTDYIFVYVVPYAVGVETAAQVLDWGTPLPNVIGHSSSEDANDKEWRHYGTGPQTELEILEYPVTLSLEASAKLGELGVFLGFDIDTTKVSLKSAASLDSKGKVHIAQAGFTSVGEPVEVEFWSAVQWTSLGSSGSAGTSVTYKGYELSGKAKDKYIMSGPLMQTIDVKVSGSGQITSSDGIIDVTVSSTIFTYTNGATIELTAIDNLEEFENWNGASFIGDPTDRTVSVVVHDENQWILAFFTNV